MTATNSAGVSLTVLVLVSCLGIALTLMGGWYFQSSLVEVEEQQQQLQFSVVELKAQRQENAKTVRQLKETVRTQGIQLTELQLQLTKVSGIFVLKLVCIALYFSLENVCGYH